MCEKQAVFLDIEVKCTKKRQFFGSHDQRSAHRSGSIFITEFGGYLSWQFHNRYILVADTKAYSLGLIKTLTKITMSEKMNV